MKRFLVPLIIISLLFSVTLGLAAMNHMDGQGHGQCPFEVMGVASCGLAKNAFDFIIPHLNLFSRLFSATLFNSISLAALSLLALGLFAVFRKEFLVLQPRFLVAENYFSSSFVSSAAKRTTHWLALHENSPAFIGRR
ncbi:MAG: hypothetical protein A3I89_00885 [Candidatus Harrisonbacteria bacterium RIFCSPLOWO2_02_FULL_41_11]|nr:MAG: hypothetical protein A3I89_00885 [Candidatus Harrisonbacteria bacterium RIFCSPLOWO2_02_FULL_41_11]